MSSLVSRISNNKHFKYGVPFFLFIFGGKLMLEEFRSVRYDSELNPRGNKKLISPEEFEEELAKKAGKAIEIQKRKEKSAEEHLEEISKELGWENPDNWENKRGPRPWEGTVEKREIRRVKKEPLQVKDLL